MFVIKRNGALLALSTHSGAPSTLRESEAMQGREDQIETLPFSLVGLKEGILFCPAELLICIVLNFPISFAVVALIQIL